MPAIINDKTQFPTLHGFGFVRAEVWYEVRGELSGTAHYLMVEIAVPCENNNVLEAIFSVMQGENWSPNGEARPFIEGTPVRHTSMSMGDQIYFPQSGKCYEVDVVGFKEIK